jgi:FAD/FMN-containing dehydrogenase
MTGGIPKLIMLVEFVSNSEVEVRNEVQDAMMVVKKYKVKARITRHGGDMQKYWNIRRDSFKLLTDHSKELRTAPFIDDIVVDPKVLPEYLPQLINLLDDYGLLYTIAGHVGNGNLHIIPLMDFKDPNTHKIIEEVSTKVYEMVKHFGGSMTAEHNDGLIRTPFLPLMFGQEVYDVFVETKEIFDHRYMFNPKKKVGATKADIKKYILKPGQSYK